MLSEATRWSIFDLPNLGEHTLALICYLDDSSNDAAVCALGGYIAETDAWARYERHAHDIYKDFGVETLHTKDLHGSKGEFKGWSRDQKHNFVEALFDEAKSCGAVGIAACTRNSIGKKFNQANKTTAQISTMGLLFARVVMSICTKNSIYHIDHTSKDVSVIVERGNKNNNGLLKHFDEVSEHGTTFDFMKSLSFVGKKDCYAIQLADFCAFYFRRMGAKTLNGHVALDVDEAITIQEALEPLPAIAAYRCPHHLKLINRIGISEETGGVLVYADSYSADPEDLEFVPSSHA